MCGCRVKGGFARVPRSAALDPAESRFRRPGDVFDIFKRKAMDKEEVVIAALRALGVREVEYSLDGGGNSGDVMLERATFLDGHVVNELPAIPVGINIQGEVLTLECMLVTDKRYGGLRPRYPFSPPSPLPTWRHSAGSKSTSQPPRARQLRQTPGVSPSAKRPSSSRRHLAILAAGLHSRMLILKFKALAQ